MKGFQVFTDIFNSCLNFYNTLFPVTCIVFLIILRQKDVLYNLNYIQGSGIVFCVSYIHSRTMYAVLMERA